VDALLPCSALFARIWPLAPVDIAQAAIKKVANWRTDKSERLALARSAGSLEVKVIANWEPETA
jgi:hypothetical protein